MAPVSEDITLLPRYIYNMAMLESFPVETIVETIALMTIPFQYHLLTMLMLYIMSRFDAALNVQTRHLTSAPTMITSLPLQVGQLCPLWT